MDSSKNNLVSVIIPTYNRADIINDSIKSVFDQTYKNWEIIIVDDGSTDNISEIIDKYKNNKLNYFTIPHSGIPAKVRNYGISQSQGKYISFLDSDDIWFQNKLEKQIYSIEKNANSAFVCSNAQLFGCLDIIKKKNYFDYNEINSFSGNIFTKLLEGNFIITSTVLVKRECLNEVGYFNENEKIRFTEDYELWLRLSYKFEVIYLNEPLIYYRVHREKPERDLEIDLNCLANVLMDIEESKYDLNYSNIQLINKRISNCYREIGRYYLKKDNFIKSKEYFKKSLIWGPKDIDLLFMFFISKLKFIPISKLINIRNNLNNFFKK